MLANGGGLQRARRVRRGRRGASRAATSGPRAPGSSGRSRLPHDRGGGPRRDAGGRRGRVGGERGGREAVGGEAGSAVAGPRLGPPAAAGLRPGRMSLGQPRPLNEHGLPMSQAPLPASNCPPPAHRRPPGGNGFRRGWRRCTTDRRRLSMMLAPAGQRSGDPAGRPADSGGTWERRTGLRAERAFRGWSPATLRGTGTVDRPRVLMSVHRLAGGRHRRLVAPDAAHEVAGLPEKWPDGSGRGPGSGSSGTPQRGYRLYQIAPEMRKYSFVICGASRASPWRLAGERCVADRERELSGRDVAGRERRRVARSASSPALRSGPTLGDGPDEAALHPLWAGPPDDDPTEMARAVGLTGPGGSR